MNYTRLEVTCPSEYTEILIAELAEAGFGMFMETDAGFEADAEEDSADLTAVESIRNKYAHVSPLTITTSSVPKQNWNEEWEKHVEPVIVDDQCLIRAEFHQIQKKYPYEIIITPKMSFGTGHHQTTHLMIKSQMTLDHRNKLVMDAGCGTAVLSIMASKLGASNVEAFDIDEWSILNGQENAALNGCSNIRIRQGAIADFDWPNPFDVILANINKNILLTEMAIYAKNLKPGGKLLLSGFYVKDIPDLSARAKACGLDTISHAEREDWAALTLVRSV